MSASQLTPISIDSNQSDVSNVRLLLISLARTPPNYAIPLTLIQSTMSGPAGWRLKLLEASAAAPPGRTTTTAAQWAEPSRAKQCSASLINATTGQQKDHLNAGQAVGTVSPAVSPPVSQSIRQSVSQSVSQWASLGVYLHVCSSCLVPCLVLWFWTALETISLDSNGRMGGLGGRKPLYSI